MRTSDVDRTRLEVAVAAAQLGLFEWNIADDRITWESSRVHEILGIAAAEPLPGSSAALVALIDHPDDAAALRQALERAETDHVIDLQCRIRRDRDGASRWIKLHGRIACSSPACLVGAVVDVTSQRAAEPQPAASGVSRAMQPARAADEQLRLAIRSTGLGIFDWDLACDQLLWSDRARQILDMPTQMPDSLDTFLTRVHPDDRGRVAAVIHAVLDPHGTGAFQTEYRIVTRDGATRWVDARGQVHFAGQARARRPVRLVGTVLNVTDRKATEQTLDEQRERLSLAMAAGQMGAWEWNLTTGMRFWNDEMYRIFGLDPASGPPQRDALLELVHPDDRAAMHEQLEQAARGARYEAEYRIVHPGGGAVRWVHAQGRLIDDPNTATVRLIGICMDVTAHKQAEASLREADARKDEFLAMLAHELRNPLSALTNALRLLAREVDTDRGRNMLQISDRQVKQLTRLVDDLLEVARITQGRIVLKRAPMTVASAVRNAIDSVQPIIDARRQTLVVRAPARSPQVVADAARLAQVLENLLTNASKYTDEGGAIQIDVEQRAEEVLISVVDTGIGIDPQALPRVFDLFTQVDSTLDRSQGGLGIGLALVKRLVELHGGSVTAESAGKNQGARFTVRLPCGCTDCTQCAVGRSAADHAVS